MADRLSHLPSLNERRTASDYVAEALRQAIIAGQFADGEELNQVELASHFNVSRVPIREALRRLQAEGLVSAEAHRRAVVVGFNRERISEVYEIRALLESYMLERAASQLDESDLAALRRMCDEMDRIKDHDKWLARNHEFHRGLLSPSGATTAMTLVEQLSMQVERYLRRSGGVHRPKEAGREHRKIVDALRKGETDTAREVLTRHILHTRDRVLEALPAGDGAEDEMAGAEPLA
jgi:DNA-binding GntR family transcriptional regulator